MRLTVCSPIHNEQENIPDLVSRVKAAVEPVVGKDWEHLLVDDCSTDRSRFVIQQLQKSEPQLKLICHQVNQGERAAWATAFENARGQIVIIMAGDLQSPPEEIPKILNPVLKEGFDVGTGLRLRRKDGVFYWLSTRVLTLYMKLVFGLRVDDPSSSFFATKREFLNGLNLIHNDHRYILSLVKKRGASIKEVPFEHAPRIRGKSHYNRLKVIYAFPELIKFTIRYYSGFYFKPPSAK